METDEEFQAEAKALGIDLSHMNRKQAIQMLGLLNVQDAENAPRLSTWTKPPEGMTEFSGSCELISDETLLAIYYVPTGSGGPGKHAKVDHYAVI